MAVTIFAFTGAWQDSFSPLLHLGTEPKYTLQLGLQILKAGGGGLPLWNWVMAASLAVMLPVIGLFLLGQRYFIEGLTAGGVKG